jgi:hypothetical protein
MLEPIEGAPDGVVAYRAIGEITAEDYDGTLRPAVDAAAARGRLRLVFELGTEFGGYSAGAAWEDFKLGGGNLTNWERCAVVTDHRMLGDAIRAFGMLMPGEIKVFTVDQTAEALAWAAGQG